MKRTIVRTIAVIVIAVMAFTFTGCGKIVDTYTGEISWVMTNDVYIEGEDLQRGIENGTITEPECIIQYVDDELDYIKFYNTTYYADEINTVGATDESIVYNVTSTDGGILDITINFTTETISVLGTASDGTSVLYTFGFEL